MAGPVPDGPRSDDDWLAPHRQYLDPSMTIELGCAEGRDTKWLMDHGIGVIATDISEDALAAHAHALPNVPRVRIDIGAGLPFATGAAGAILASLSLHYFAWAQTVRTVADIRRVLRPGGWLVMRVNSRRDVYYGARGHPRIEPNYYRVGTRGKRFFDADDIAKLAANGWSLDFIEASTIDRYDRSKHVWTTRLQRDARP